MPQPWIEPEAVSFLEPLHERPWQGGAAADDEAQGRHVELVIVAVAVEVGPHGRHRGRDRRSLGGDEPGERLGLEVAAGHEQRRARQEGGVGQAPAAGVELRDDRQGPVPGSSPRTPACTPRGSAGTSSGASTRRLWGRPWCRSCSTCWRRRARRAPGSRSPAPRRRGARGSGGRAGRCRRAREASPSPTTIHASTVDSCEATGASTGTSVESTRTTRSSAWLATNTSCSGDRRMLRVCSTEPMQGTAK